MRSLLTLSALFGLTLGATAQTAPWTSLTLASSPTSRASLNGASDGTKLFFFGGNHKPSGASPTFHSDLWSFDGTTWTLEAAEGAGPGARLNYAMEWDAARGVLVLFGGRDPIASVQTNETWEWSPSGGWSQKTPATVPGKRRWMDMAYVPGLGCVMHGGADTSLSVAYDDTWAWDGTNWTLLDNGPYARSRGRMVHRPAQNDLLWYGGKNAASATLTETWSFDLTTMSWSQIPTTTLPKKPGSATDGLFAHGMYFDAATGRAVIQGGTQGGVESNGTWEFDGTDWTDVTQVGGPGNRTAPAIAWISTKNVAYMFGGFSGQTLGDTWSRGISVPGLFLTSGVGCPTSGGLTASVSSNTMPLIGSGIDLQFDNLTVGTLPYAVLGLSSLDWLGIPLPIPMGTFFPGSGVGCDLQCSPDKFIALPSGTSANLVLPIPNDPAFTGLPIHAQAVQIEVVGGNVVAATSNLGTSVLGQP